MAQAELEARNGQIIVGSIVAVTMQRNSREENRRIKDGEVPKDWAAHKASQKDSDARRTKKYGESYFGYNNHVDVDAAHELTRDRETTRREAAFFEVP